MSDEPMICLKRKTGEKTENKRQNYDATNINLSSLVLLSDENSLFNVAQKTAKWKDFSSII